MQLVIYLSGRAQIRPSQDSVAASVTIPKALERKLLDALLATGYLEEEPEKAWKILLLDESIDDFFSDVEDNGPVDPLHAIAADVRALTRCEASCGYIHLVKGRA